MKARTSPLVVNGQTFAAGLRFEIPGAIAAIAPMVDEIMAFLEQENAAGGKEGEVMLALQEALANAVVHGCKQDASKVVVGQVACDPQLGVAIMVRDPGPGFDSGHVPDPLSEEGLAKSHGRGIHLISQLMDEVRFERNGAEVHMRKR
jgi:serine/threonine-protein kinase RsbW